MLTLAVQDSLLNCIDIGKEKVDSFIHCVFDKTGDRYFHDPIKLTKLKTFADMNKKVKIKTKNGFKLAQSSPELIMRRAIAISNSRTGLS